jgi:predicted amidohydrolase YtcJ
MRPTTIYHARRIRTLNPTNPLATHVAVRDGRILGAGSLEELQGWGDYRLDGRFADKVLLPGFVEAHSHLMEGALWRFIYVGFHDRVDPDGTVWPGAGSIDAVVARLASESARRGDDAAQPLVGWGLDPIYFGGRRCNRDDLDRVSTTRPVAVIHASLHIVNANTPALAAAGYLRPGILHPGLPLADDGLPTGECKGPDAMAPVAAKVGLDRGLLAADTNALRAFSRLCVRKGVTTATDLAAPLTPESVAGLLAVTAEPGFPTRIVALLRQLAQSPQQLIERALELRDQSTERLRLGMVKLVADGSIQGFSARLRWPGYYNGQPNGLWYTAPEQVQEILHRALQAGVAVHAHTNGDEATDMVLDAMAAALAAHPVPDHRFTLQHCQLADAAQFRRIRALGMCVNLFANHTFYWGDAHAEQTVGPERAARMNACATARAAGVPFAIHSDAPVTPLGPLFTAWCAVNRLTSGGRLLGPQERIGVADALRAVTLGAAHTLKLDAEIGSIETGKRADFAVLDADPMDTAPEALKDIGVWGVVANGLPVAAGSS